MSQQTDIQQIENYYRGLLSQEEQKAVEDRINTDASFAEEVTNYTSLFTGFQTEMDTMFQQKLLDWNQKWEANDELELMEMYLFQQLGPHATAKFEEKLVADPEFAQRFAQQRLLWEAMNSTREQQFEQKLNEWSKTAEAKAETENKTNLSANIPAASPEAKVVGINRFRQIKWQRWAAAASFLLILFVGLRFTVGSGYDNNSLAAAAYQAPPEDITMSDQTLTKDNIVKEFDKAHRLLAQGDFGAAESAFDRLRDMLPDSELSDFDAQYYRENIDWNDLLAELGSNQLEANFDQRLEGIASNESHAYQESASQLKRQLNSIWRKF